MWIRRMREAWRNYRRAYKYQAFAYKLYEKGTSMPKSWDCDMRLREVIKRMRADGLVIKNDMIGDGDVMAYGDYVVVWGYIGLYKHVSMVMRGDYIVDAATGNKPLGFERSWPRKIYWVERD